MRAFLREPRLDHLSITGLDPNTAQEIDFLRARVKQLELKLKEARDANLTLSHALQAMRRKPYEARTPLAAAAITEASSAPPPDRF